MIRSERPRPWHILLVFLLVSALAGVLAWALWSLPSEADGLSSLVRERLPLSGVDAEVTAVLLNFRAYDTLLELAVLLAALLGVWQLGPLQLAGRDLAPGPVLKNLVRYLAPLMVLVSGYLLWLGGHTAGGAFQAGALLAGGGVLLLVAWPEAVALRDDYRLRLLLAAGLGVFACVAVGVMLAGGALLEYPPLQAGRLILLIEAASTFSIGISLTLLFAGGHPAGGRER